MSSTAEASSSVEASAATNGGANAGKLDEVMLAMDVVDTLRHHENVALQELEQEGRDEVLKERLRRIYESQGLAVSDRILDEGIRALKESRFVYTPTAPGRDRTLAGLWVRRGAWGRGVGIVVLVAALFVGYSAWRQASHQRELEAARIELAEALPARLENVASATLAEAKAPAAREQAGTLHENGISALAQGNAADARTAIAALEKLRADLVQSYRLRIVSRPGEDTGVFRIPDVNSNARNYYLIVEAVGADGKVLSLPVTSEEDGKVKTVTRWGVRVPQRTFDAVRRDKQDDGILQNDTLGEKPRGALETSWRMPVSGGAITEW